MPYFFHSQLHEEWLHCKTLTGLSVLEHLFVHLCLVPSQNETLTGNELAFIMIVHSSLGSLDTWPHAVASFFTGRKRDWQQLKRLATTVLLLLLRRELLLGVLLNRKPNVYSGSGANVSGAFLR